MATSNSVDLAVIVNLIGQSILMLQARRSEEALHCLNQALQIAPDFPPALVKRGTLLHALSRHAEAVADFDRCLALKPDMEHVRALRNAALLRMLGDLDRASPQASPPFRIAYERGLLLQRLQRDAEALACYRQVVEIDPNHLEALNCLGNLLLHMHRQDDALECYERILALAPHNAVALFNRGNVLQQNGRYHDALSSYDAALAERPEWPEALIEQAHCLLTTGDLPAGWPLFEARWGTLQLRDAKLRTSAPMWRGEATASGEVLLLWAEQGLGDAIQFVRYLPLAAQRAANIVLQVPPGLTAIIASMATDITASGPGRCSIRVVDNTEPIVAHDFHCPLMSLPLIFGTDLRSIPHSIPYLKPSEASASRWQAILGVCSKPRIGLVWAGGQRLLNNPTRDMSLDLLHPLLDCDAEWVSLQKSPSDTDLCILQTMPHMYCAGHELADFADTAGLIQQLDLVIGIDSAVAHLAGAMGKPVWLMLRKSGEWRWMEGRSDSPWYPSHRIFRQKNHGEWREVVQEIVQDLDYLIDAWEVRSGKPDITVLNN